MKPQSYGSHSNCKMCTYVKAGILPPKAAIKYAWGSCMTDTWRTVQVWNPWATKHLGSVRVSGRKDLSSWALQSLTLPRAEALMGAVGGSTCTIEPRWSQSEVTPELKVLWIKQLLLISWNVQPEGVITTKALWKNSLFTVLTIHKSCEQIARSLIDQEEWFVPCWSYSSHLFALSFIIHGMVSSDRRMLSILLSGAPPTTG